MAQQPWWPLTGHEDALRGVQGLCLAGPARAGWGVLSATALLWWLHPPSSLTQGQGAALGALAAPLGSVESWLLLHLPAQLCHPSTTPP